MKTNKTRTMLIAEREAELELEQAVRDYDIQPSSENYDRMVAAQSNYFAVRDDAE